MGRFDDVIGFARRYLASGETVVVGNAKPFLDELRKRFPGLEVIPYSKLNLNRALP